MSQSFERCSEIPSSRYIVCASTVVTHEHRLSGVVERKMCRFVGSGINVRSTTKYNGSSTAFNASNSKFKK